MCFQFDDKENAKRVRYFKELTSPPAINEKEVERIKALWSDKNISDCVKQMYSSSDLIVHNLAYLVERLDVIAGENYIPSDEDILHIRQRSTGGFETSFVVCFVASQLIHCLQKDKTKITLVDMGGQRPERAKWDKALAEGTKGVFYFVSIEEFNVISTEEKDKTKLQVSLDTWKDLLANPLLANVSIILLFNKMDLFEAKLSQGFSCVLDQFPDYEGEKTKDAAIDYIRSMFVDAVPEGYNLDFISSFVCCALDTALMGKLFTEAKQHIVRRSLMANGF